MNEPSRRGAIGVLVGLGGAAALGALPRTVVAQSSVAIPAQPMRLTRRLERSLHGGATISVGRSWRIEFSRQSDERPADINVSGVQLDVEVDAPESLAPLVEIEQSRSTDAMWPITLSSGGRVTATGRGTGADDIAAAIAKAQHMIAERPIPANRREAQQVYLQELQLAGSSLLDQLPDDLFYPLERPLNSSRTVELPGGLIGQFELTYDAHRAVGCDWLHNATREVVTRIGQSEQRAKEQWLLTNI